MPGLHVVAPSTPADARGLLQAAIRSDDPVLYLEHRALYWTRGEVPEGDDAALVPLGRAVDPAAGHGRDDRLLVAHGAGGPCRCERPGGRGHRGGGHRPALAGAAGPGHGAGVRGAAPGGWWWPMRRSTTGGFGGEIAARVGEAAFDLLRAPVVRVGAPAVPPPFSPDLEARFVPDAPPSSPRSAARWSRVRSGARPAVTPATSA